MKSEDDMFEDESKQMDDSDDDYSEENVSSHISDMRQGNCGWLRL